jgi:hypothetical protein
MIHTFRRAGVEKLLAHTLAAKTHCALYENKATKKPGLWLVGDSGVYLMSNGEPPCLREPAAGEVVPEGTTLNFIVYATEVNPTTLVFDVWWERKNAGFGSDDGAEFLLATDLQEALRTYSPRRPLKLDITSAGIAVVAYRRKGS